jgi:hypothetical protein
MSQMKVNKAMCATCPWRDGSPYAYLTAGLERSALGEASRICHSTGSNNAINARTGRPAALCRGARNVQLNVLAAMGFLSAPTDDAWAAKCRELGIKQDVAK